MPLRIHKIMPFSVESALKAANKRITEQEKAAAAEFQAEMRDNLGSLTDPNSVESRLARSKQQEKAIIEQIEFLKWKPNNELKENRLNQALNRLAELVAEQGRFSEASKIAVDAERRTYYKSLAKAAEIPDETNCQCPPEKVFDAKTRAEITVQPEMILAEVVADGQIKHLTYCRSCGLTNIK